MTIGKAAKTIGKAAKTIGKVAKTIGKAANFKEELPTELRLVIYEFGPIHNY